MQVLVLLLRLAALILHVLKLERKFGDLGGFFCFLFGVGGHIGLIAFLELLELLVPQLQFNDFDLQLGVFLLKIVGHFDQLLQLLGVHLLHIGHLDVRLLSEDDVLSQSSEKDLDLADLGPRKELL